MVVPTNSDMGIEMLAQVLLCNGREATQIVECLQMGGLETDFIPLLLVERHVLVAVLDQCFELRKLHGAQPLPGVIRGDAAREMIVQVQQNMIK